MISTKMWVQDRKTLGIILRLQQSEDQAKTIAEFHWQFFHKIKIWTKYNSDFQMFYMVFSSSVQERNF